MLQATGTVELKTTDPSGTDFAQKLLIIESRLNNETAQEIYKLTGVGIRFHLGPVTERT